MKIAVAAYPLSAPAEWEDYARKTSAWVGEAAAEGARLLVFPEYGRMELAALDGPGVAGDLERSLRSVSDWTGRANHLTEQLAQDHGVYILAPSGPVFDGGARPVNRAYLFGPEGPMGWQDKQIMTRFERETWDVRPGGPLNLFEIGGIRTGILICYDSEFPLLARNLVEQGAEMILVPSCTDTLAGYWRVRIGAMARALEGQCVVVHSPTTGDAAWSPAVDTNVGAAAVYGPPDLGFPPTGILAEGALDLPGWVYAGIDPGAVQRVRREGHVLNLAHWTDSERRDTTAKTVTSARDTA